MSGWRAPERIFVGMGVTFDAATWAWYLAAIVWWTVDLGYGPLQLVLLGTVLEVTALVTEVPTGMVADRVSRKWSVVSSYAMMSTAMMLSAATRDYGVMLAAQALFGLGWTFRSGADVAWLTDERTALRRLEGESDAEALDESPALLRRHRLGITAGLLALVPVILWGDHSLRGVILVSGLGLALTTIWLAVAMTDHFRVGSDGDEHEAGMLAILREGFGVTRRVRSIRLLIVVMVLLGLGAEALDRLGFKAFLDEGDFGDESLRFTGILFATMAALGLLVVWVTESARNRGVGLGLLAVVLLSVSSVGAAIAAVAPAIGIAVGLALQDPCREALDPVTTALANEQAPESSRATVLSFVSLSHGLGNTFGGIVLALVAEALDVRWAIFAAGALWAVAMVVARLAASVTTDTPASTVDAS